MNNYLASSSELYKKLLNAYETENESRRFESCYSIVDQATYLEIHYVISKLRECEKAGDTSNIPNEPIEQILKTLKMLFAGKEASRTAFLLDILEEARERKRS